MIMRKKETKIVMTSNVKRTHIYSLIGFPREANKCNNK